jgi:hypothetical protein
MAPKPSYTSVFAGEIAQVIQLKVRDGKSHLWHVHWTPAHLLRKLTWDRLSVEERERTVIGLKGDTLTISVSTAPKRRSTNKVGKLVSLLQKCLLFVEDEELYGEVMEAIHVDG